jgi:hypothetical protein
MTIQEYRVAAIRAATDIEMRAHMPLHGQALAFAKIIQEWIMYGDLPKDDLPIEKGGHPNSPKHSESLESGKHS